MSPPDPPLDWSTLLAGGPEGQTWYIVVHTCSMLSVCVVACVCICVHACAHVRSVCSCVHVCMCACVCVCV